MFDILKKFKRVHSFVNIDSFEIEKISNRFSLPKINYLANYCNQDTLLNFCFNEQHKKLIQDIENEIFDDFGRNQISQSKLKALIFSKTATIEHGHLLYILIHLYLWDINDNSQIDSYFTEFNTYFEISKWVVNDLKKL